MSKQATEKQRKVDYERVDKIESLCQSRDFCAHKVFPQTIHARICCFYPSSLSKGVLNLSSDDIKCKLAGWGVTDINDPKSSPLLMETELPWIEQSKCNTMFDKDQRTSWIDITNKNLCFGKAEGGVDGCQVKKCFACQVRRIL